MLISEYRVLQSNTGYYVGKQYWDEEHKFWMPHSRISRYFHSDMVAAIEREYFVYEDCVDDSEYRACGYYIAGGIQALLDTWAFRDQPSEIILKRIFGEIA